MSENNERLVLEVGEVAKMLSISRSSAFKRCNDGTLPCVRIGRRLLVSRARLEAMLNGDQPQKPAAQ